MAAQYWHRCIEDPDTTAHIPNSSCSENTMQNILIAIALLAIVVYIPYILKKLKNTHDESSSD